MKKYTNVQVGQRVEHSDLAFGLLESQRQAIQSPINDVFVGSDSPTKNFVLSGFSASAVTTTITVTRGTAIVGFRDGSETQFGMLLSDGDATRNVDIASLPNNVGDPLYGVYVRFNFEDSDFANRQFWNPLAVTPVETTRNIPTRKSENWSLAVELVSPGPEWLKIYEVEKNGSSLTLTDVRPLFFDSNATGTAVVDAQWGGGNDRNANRGLYGVRGLYRFIKAVQRQLQDIIGDRWYSALPSNIISMYAARKGIGFSPVYDSATPPVGDGVTNDSANLALAINNSTESVIDLGGKTYKVNATVAITRSNITIRNGRIDMTGLTGGSDIAAFLFLGTEGTNISLTSPAFGALVNNNPSTDIEITSTAGIVAGDLVYLESVAEIATGYQLGELHRVSSILTGTTLRLTEPVLYDFLTADAAVLRKVTDRRNLKLEGLEFIGTDPGDLAHYRTAIWCEDCSDVDIVGCKFDGVYSHCIKLIRCYDAQVSKSKFKDSVKSDTGFGVAVLNGCSKVNISDCTSENIRTLVASGLTNGGLNAFLYTNNCIHGGSNDLVFYDTNTVYCAVSDSAITRNVLGNGVTVYGDRAHISNIRIQGCVDHGVAWEPRVVLGEEWCSASISNVDIVRGGETGVLVASYPGANQIGRAVVADCHIVSLANSTGSAIRVYSGGPTVRHVSIRGNSSENQGFMAIEHLQLNAGLGSIIGVSGDSNNFRNGDNAVGVQIIAAAGRTVSEVNCGVTATNLGLGFELLSSGTISNCSISGCVDSIGWSVGVSNSGSGTIRDLNVVGTYNPGILITTTSTNPIERTNINAVCDGLGLTVESNGAGGISMLRVDGAYHSTSTAAGSRAVKMTGANSISGSFTGFTRGGEWGLEAASGGSSSLLVVGHRAVGTGLGGARTGASIIYGEASTGHSWP